MRYFIQGHGEIDLSDQDFVAQGGEGKVYARGAKVYKIYHDPARMPPSAKFRELARLDRPNILRPLDILLDARQMPVGFSMAQVDRAVPLARLFTNDFRRQQNIADSAVLTLLEAMRETISFIHTQGCLLVDGNEMNYLVDESDFQTPYFIDVDAWQTPGFPATAIMPTIRDWHSRGFSELTDWFAFAIVACQVLIGIHPYKGKHPQFKKADLAARMQANISVFNPQTTVPAATRDFSVIPPAWRDWFIRLFERGERLLPPPLTGPAPVAARAAFAVVGGDHLHIILERAFPADIRWLCPAPHGGEPGICAGEVFYLGQDSYPLPPGTQCALFAPKSLALLLAGIEQGQLAVYECNPGQTARVAGAALRADKLLTVENTLYAVQGGHLTAIKISELGDKRLVSAGTVWHILPYAHQVLDGLIYQSVLGKPYLVIPYRQGAACFIGEIPELGGYRIIHGKHQNGVVVLAGNQAGRFDWLILRFDRDYRSYRFDRLDNLDQPDINFATLDNGLAVLMPHDNELWLWQREGHAEKRIAVPPLPLRLAADGTRVLGIAENRLYRLKLG